MLLYYSVLLLRCFQPNTTVMLDVQTRDAVFKAWPRSDATRETELCGKLKGDMFKLSIQTGAYEYVLNTLQSYDPAEYIEIRLPCTEVVLGVPGTCATAFKAKSAIYTMDFQEAKQNVTEAASNLRKLDFDRKACFQNARLDVGQQVQISPGVFSDQFQFVANTSNCKYPLDPQSTISNNNPLDQKAVLSFQAYPNFTYNKPQFSISPSELLKQQYNCQNKSCSEMVNGLATQSYDYFQVNYSVPSLIPDRNGQLTRMVHYTNIMESNKVRNVNLNVIDCYTSQKLRMHSRQIRIISELNESMEWCKKPLNQVLNYDKMITRVVFQENYDFRIGEHYTVDFQSAHLLNTTNEWMGCHESTNETHCYKVLAKRNQLIDYFVTVQHIFYQEEAVKTMIPLYPASEVSCFGNTVFHLSNSQICATFDQYCAGDLEQESYLFTFSFGNIGKYGNNLLNITTQATYPKSMHKYCANYNFTELQILSLSNQSTVTGELLIGSLMLPVTTINNIAPPQNVKYISYILVAVVIILFIVISSSLKYSWI
ncbi:Conserved_hypothetical protein [Hexamita inflata]|uniref:Uncharacterized protein n=1 Tax=Hexamita inflata TaxID=28002 RepID=A0AA86QG16_9EUKA|nr:Conserved hypothetical protein [Hexamita inflata]